MRKPAKDEEKKRTSEAEGLRFPRSGLVKEIEIWKLNSPGKCGACSYPITLAGGKGVRGQGNIPVIATHLELGVVAHGAVAYPTVEDSQL